MSDQRREVISDASRAIRKRASLSDMALVLSDTDAYTLADAALAVIDAAEPTDAQVEAALQKWRESRIDPLMWEGCGAGAESIECRYRNRMRAALMAARKSRT